MKKIQRVLSFFLAVILLYSTVFTGNVFAETSSEDKILTRSSIEMGFDTEFFIPATVGNSIGRAYLHTPYEDGTLTSGEELDLSLYSLNKSRAAGDVVQIIKGDTFSYNGWVTSEYSVLNGSNTYRGVCAEPSKSSPSGYYTVSVLNDDVIKALLYAFENETMRKNVYGDASYNGQFCNMHITVGYRYSGDLQGTNDEAIAGAKNTIRFFEEQFIPTYASELSEYTVYVALNDKQDIVWLEKNPSAKIKLVKSSSDPSITEGNACYSLEGAEYTIYSEKECVNSVGLLVTDANGESNTVSLKNGTYYIKETKAPKGFLKDEEVHEVTLTSENSEIPRVLSVEDKSTMDPISVLLKKVNADTNLNGNQINLSLENAEFTIKYYDVENSMIDPAETGKTPVRTWVFKTDEDGFSTLDTSYLVSGDELYLTSSGIPSLPIGTITIQETKAPEGYHINDEIFVIPINGESEGVTSYNYPEIPERALKLNLKKVQAGTEIPIKGVTFEHTKPDGTKETLETDENGELSFVGLGFGRHTVVEVDSADYVLNTNVIDFTVEEGNKITINSEAVETDTVGNISLTVDEGGDLEAIVENKPEPYSLRVLKVSDEGSKLSGAEFTLYADEKLTEVISVMETDEEGLLTIDGMIAGKTYYLRETKAPEGYRLPENNMVYSINIKSIPAEDVFTFTVNGEAFGKEDTDESRGIYYTNEDGEDTVNIRVVNSAGALLPETGSGMTVLMITVGVLLMVSVLFVSRLKKNN